MSHFNDLAAFAIVVREGSFTRAAAQLGVSQSALSHTIRTLEKRLDLKLLNRSTRSVSPTEAGEQLYQVVASRFDDIEAELAALSEFRDKPSGTVRITASEHAARDCIWPKLAPLLLNYPDVKVEICSDNRFTDIVANRFDIGVRLGDDVDKDMIAVRIAPDMRMMVVGSPAYFSRQSKPQTPQDLVAHNCIVGRLLTYGELMAWEFMRDGQRLNIRVKGQLVASSNQLIVKAALSGNGLAWLPFAAVHEHIVAGRLHSVLNDWSMVYAGHHLYYANRRVSPAVALVVEALRYDATSIVNV